MITESMVYWILALDGVVRFLVILSVLSSLACVFLGGAFLQSIETEPPETVMWYKKIFMRALFLFILLGSAVILTPTTKQMAMIKVIPMLANSEAIQTLGKDGKEIYQIGIEAIKEKLKGEK